MLRPALADLLSQQNGGAVAGHRPRALAPCVRWGTPGHAATGWPKEPPHLSGLKRKDLRFHPRVVSVPGSWDTQGPRMTEQPPVQTVMAPCRRSWSRGACHTSVTSYHRSLAVSKSKGRDSLVLSASRILITLHHSHGRRLDGRPVGHDAVPPQGHRGRGCPGGPSPLLI